MACECTEFRRYGATVHVVCKRPMTLLVLRWKIHSWDDTLLILLPVPSTHYAESLFIVLMDHGDEYAPPTVCDHIAHTERL